MPDQTFLSLYSGAGGLDLGFIRAGFVPVLANDIDFFAVATYDLAIPGGHAVCCPVESLPLPPVHSVDVVAGGPPCQGWSQAGKMNPDDPRSKHVWVFLDTVRRLRPLAFVMENVQNLGSGSRWSTVREKLVAESEAMGYRTTLMLLDAADYGVPQSRIRMFLVGTPPYRPEPKFPVCHPHRISCGDALRGLPALGSPGNDTFCVAKVVPAKNPVIRKSPFAGMLFNGQGRPMDLQRPSPTLPASMGGNRTPIVDQEWLSGGLSWVKWYHSCLVAGEKPFREAPSRLRRLTLEEAAILQGFPRGMVFSGPVSARFRQVGNAVPPGLAFAVASSIKRTLAQ